MNNIEQWAYALDGIYINDEERFFMISNIIALVVFPQLVILTFFHKYKKGSFDKDFFSKRQTTTLKGIIIFVVFFHHFPQIVDGAKWINNAYCNGQYSIALFFLLAGYTTCIRYKNAVRIDYKKVWINRCWRLYLPIVIFTLYINNFMTPLLFFYICTDIVFAKIKSDKAKILVLFICNILFAVACMMMGKQDYWYNDILTYWIGATIAFRKSEIVDFFAGAKYWITIITLAIVFAVSYYFAYHWMHHAYSTIVLSTSGALIIFLIMMKVDIRSSFFEFVGRYTFEIYMLHQLILQVMNKLFTHSSLVLVSSLLCTIILSVLLQRTVLILKEKAGA